MISVIMPVYNDAETIHRSIYSVRKQNCNWELIIVNDGSTDNSGEICDRYAEEDNRITVIHTINKGPSAARNVGIQESTRDYITFLDADDTLEDNALNNLLDRSVYDLVIGDFNKVRKGEIYLSGNEGFGNSPNRSMFNIRHYAVKNYLKNPNKFPLLTQSWGKLFKSEIIKDNNIRFDTSLRTFEDVKFNFDYLKKADSFYYVDKIVYNHHLGSGYASATMNMQNSPDVLFGFKRALESVEKFLLDGGAHPGSTKKAIKLAYSKYTVIQLIRLCGQANSENKVRIINYIKGLVNSYEVQSSFKYHVIGKGDSRLIPLFIKLKIPLFVYWASKLKAKFRYGWI